MARIVINNVPDEFKIKFKVLCAKKKIDMQEYALKAIQEKIQREGG